MKNIFDEIAHIVSAAFNVPNPIEKGKQGAQGYARCAFFWLCKHYTDARLRNMKEYSNYKESSIWKFIKKADKLIFTSKVFCKNLTSCIKKMKVYTGIKPPKKDVYEIKKRKPDNSLFDNYSKEEVQIISTIITLSDDAPLEISGGELHKYSGIESYSSFFKCLYSLRDNGVIRYEKGKGISRIFQVVDSDVLACFKITKAKAEDRKSFAKNLPDSVMVHVEALKKIRENRAKKFGM